MIFYEVVANLGLISYHFINLITKLLSKKACNIGSL